MSSLPSELWDATDRELGRAERLLHHSLERIDREQQSRRADRERLALDLERMITDLETLSSGLTELITSMDGERQDNRSRRWQGQLLQLLSPIDSGLEQLRDLLTWLDQDLEPATQDPQGQRRVQQQSQMKLLLNRRQQQLIKLEAEVQELRSRLFAMTATNEDEPQVITPLTPSNASDQNQHPSIFS